MLLPVSFYLNIVTALVSVIGLVDNIINTIIFRRLGLKDSMSIGLFLLSLTDFFVNLLTLGICACFLADSILQDKPINLVAVVYVALGWTRDNLYYASCWITTVLSVERCVCVVSPFKVKQIFTKFRCACLVLTIYVIIFVLHAPVYATQSLVWKTLNVTVNTANTGHWENPKFQNSRNATARDRSYSPSYEATSNPHRNWTESIGSWPMGSSCDDSCATPVVHVVSSWETIGEFGKGPDRTITRRVLAVVFAINRPKIEVYIDVVSSIALPFPSQLVVIVCAILLVIGLRATSRIRNVATFKSYKTNVKGLSARSVSNNDKQVTDKVGQKSSTPKLKTVQVLPKSTDGSQQYGTMAADGRTQSAFTATTTLQETNCNDFTKRTEEAKLSVRETRLVKVVICLAVVLTVCNVPKVLATFSSYIFPNVNLGGSDQDLYILMWDIAALFGAVNSSVNTFIYLIVNRSFRKLAALLIHSNGQKYDRNTY